MRRRLIALLALALSLVGTVSFAKTVTSISLSTDKAMYSPGDRVKIAITVTGIQDTEALNYRVFHLNKLVSSGVTSAALDLNWVAPDTDFQGYLVQVYQKKNKAVSASIAIDVSSTWTKFPRYGFLSDFSITDEKTMQGVIEKLNRYHINGIQFYDWQDSHSQPLTVIAGTPLSSWQDINHRLTYFQTVKNYIDLAHSRNMKAMNYNLAYGAYQDVAATIPELALYTDANHQHQATWPLPGWESDLYLENPANTTWQDYLIQKENDLPPYLSFDGWHVDQLGSANYYDYSGNRVDLAAGFQAFLTSAKTHYPHELLMNAVDAYAQREIMRSQATSFNYTEVWNNSRSYSDLGILLDNNWANSKAITGSNKPSVLAAYMNYNKANFKGTFNPAGVILTDASIFANGGAHLELGEHMLGKEYFPNNNLTMSSTLQRQLQAYYDFQVAYENLLRGDYRPVTLSADVAKTELSLDTLAMPNTIWMFARNVGSTKVIHLINLKGVKDTAWRDLDGKRETPKEQKNLRLTIYSSQKVKSIYYATPDGDGLTHSLTFKQTGRKVSVSIPDLKYWDMLVMNY